MNKNRLVTAAVLVALLVTPLTLYGQTLAQQDRASASSPTRTGSEGLPTDQIIIQFKSATAADNLLRSADDGQLAELSQAAGLDLTYQRPMSGDAHVLKLPERLPPAEVAAAAAKLAKLEDVAYAEPDLIKRIASAPDRDPQAPTLSPNDPQYTNQWHYQYTASSYEGLNLEPAWNITTGISSTVVAVIDTGILNHADLAGRTVPGYDFISDSFVANDGGGRDLDPSDPGDWVTADECGYTHDPADSSWHGTHVAGTIGAATNNGVGVAGVNWHARILPVRVLGKCGGLSSDIIDGMRWAAGLSVPGVPNNLNPAKVLNLSLGGPGSCTVSEQNAVNDIVAAGATLIVAAGNENDDASNYAPGNCNSVLTVAATDRYGDRAYYSNYGSVIEVSAPGGAQYSANDPEGILSTLNSGATAPVSDNYEYYQGTSMATPHVAGLASLLLALDPGYSPASLMGDIQSTARPFPSGSTCNTSICGTGIADAYRALNSFVPRDEFVYLPLVIQNYPETQVVMVNTDFEAGHTGWTEYSSNGYAIIGPSPDPNSLPPHSGSWLAWLGGDNNETAYIAQEATVMANQPHFAYWHWVGSLESSCVYDFARLMIDGTEVDSYPLCDANNTGGWVQYSVDLSAYIGQTVEIQIRIENDVSNNSNLFVDDVSFRASPALRSTSTEPMVDSETIDALKKTN